jgi:peptidoglycan-N-acetylglucosamine deacetylase
MNRFFTFKFTIWSFLILIVTLIITDFFVDVPFLLYIIPVIVLLVVLGVGSANIASGFHLKAICKAETNEKKIAITFDDGPVKDITPQVLDLLKVHKAPATFFCIGKRILGNEDIIKRIDEEGHNIGNHTFSHAYLFDFYLPSKVTEELVNTNKIISSIINKKPKFFRPPYGVTNPAITKAVKRANLDVVGWNQRSLDTVIIDEEKILSRITADLKGGDIILFHDIHPRIIGVLEKFLEFASRNGFKIVGLDQLIRKQAYE